MPSLRLVFASLCAILVLAAAALSAAEPKSLLLLAQGPDGHPPGTHEYMAGIERLAGLLESTPGLKLRIAKANEPWTEGPKLLAETDGVVMFLSEGARWAQADAARYEALTRLAARGGGFVALHWAIGTKEAGPIEPFLRLLGGCHGGPDRKYQVVETDLRFEPTNPIAKGLENFRARDEFYYRLKFTSATPGIQPVLTAKIDGGDETVAWSWERPDGGRSFGFSGLHFNDNWQLPEYRKLVTSAARWTLNLPTP